MLAGLLTLLPKPDENHLTFGVVCVAFVVALLVVALKPRDRQSLTFCALLVTSALAMQAGRLMEEQVVGADAIFASALGLQVPAFLGYSAAFAASEAPEATGARGAYFRMTPVASRIALFCSAYTLIQLWLGEQLANIGSVALSVAQIGGLVLGLAVLATPFLQAGSLRVRYMSGVVWVGAVVAYLPALFCNTIPLLLGRQPMMSSLGAALLLLALPLALGFASIRWRGGSLLALIDRVSVYVLLGFFLLLTDIVLVVGVQ